MIDPNQIRVQRHPGRDDPLSYVRAIAGGDLLFSMNWGETPAFSEVLCMRKGRLVRESNFENLIFLAKN